MEKQTVGAWVVHHGRKVAADMRGAAEFSAIDLAAKSAGLLARLGESDEATLTAEQVTAAAKVGNLNPKTELAACLGHLQKRKLIDRSSSGAVSVLGVTGSSALTHAADLFEDNEPHATERAAITLAELSSQAPVTAVGAIEFLSDTHKLTTADATDFVQQASQIGFVDAEGEGTDKLLFNGNLFRRDTASKAKKVIDSLNSAEQARIVEFDAKVKARGAVTATTATKILGEALFAKVRAAALYDMNVVSNEAGDHVFITSPGSFHKFSNPLTEDAFDHAKALVSALTYGMTHSPSARGQIWGIDLLLGKLIRGGSVGPATAIGNDYRALELERVVQTERSGYGFKMRLLKREVGVIALEVLKGRNAAAAALETLPSAGMRSYTAPEAARVGLRKGQSVASRAQTRSLLSAVRGGGRAMKAKPTNSTKKTGKKGFETEEIVRSYFLGAGFFVVRGVKLRHGGDELTDIDLWLYERSTTLARRRIIIDIKDNAQPKAAERLFFVKGLAELIQVEATGVVTTDARRSLRELARKHNVLWIDNADLQRLKSSQRLTASSRLSDEDLNEFIADIDTLRSSKNARDVFASVKSAVADRFGPSCANTAIDGAQYFAKMSVEAHPGSIPAQLFTRLTYFSAAIAAAALDFTSGESALRPHQERLASLTDAIRFGQDPRGTAEKLRWAQAAIRDYAPNGAGLAEIIHTRFSEALHAVPAESLAEITAKLTNSDRLFSAARDLEQAAFLIDCPPFDDLTVDAKSFLGAVLDFIAIDRLTFSQGWNPPKHAPAAAKEDAAPASAFPSSEGTAPPTDHGKLL